jgi:chorismate dehydratase
MTVRVGVINYLNTRPLLFGLERLAPEVEVVLDFPSRLADGLASGRLDVAIIPSIEYLRQPGTTIVSDACIACDGPVRSVKLYSRVPMERIRCLALDEGSRTSAALTRILLRDRFAREPELRPMPLGASPAEADAEAVMLIGDRAIRTPDGDFRFVWDLGEEWSRETGLPFVFALWVARAGADLHDADRLLAAARDEGLRHLEAIAQSAAPEVGLPEAECLVYLRDHLRFHLGPRQRQGLELFYDRAVRHGLAPKRGELVFYHRDDS